MIPSPSIEHGTGSCAHSLVSFLPVLALASGLRAYRPAAASAMHSASRAAAADSCVTIMRQSGANHARGCAARDKHN
jgi:hypothetical protein